MIDRRVLPGESERAGSVGGVDGEAIERFAADSAQRQGLLTADVMHCLRRLSERILDRSAFAVVVCGFPGSGKTTVAQQLAAMTGAVVLDKDAYAPELEEHVMSRLAGDPHDRDSETYRTVVGPHVYSALMSTAFRVAERYPVIVDAPCLGYLRAATAQRIRLADLLLQRAGMDIPIVTAWVDCDDESIRTRMLARGALRDGSKIADWPAYVEAVLGAGLREQVEEVVDVVVDN